MFIKLNHKFWKLVSIDQLMIDSTFKSISKSKIILFFINVLDLDLLYIFKFTRMKLIMCVILTRWIECDQTYHNTTTIMKMHLSHNYHKQTSKKKKAWPSPHSVLLHYFIFSSPQNGVWKPNS